jgi:very-short-patch-repair endonuclease
MESVEEVVELLGGVATRASIVARGVSKRALTQGLRAGRIQRVRQGWYAVPQASTDVVAAVRVGGALTSVSAGRYYGLWILEDDRIHVAVPTNASRLRLPQRMEDPASSDPGANVGPGADAGAGANAGSGMDVGGQDGAAKALCPTVVSHVAALPMVGSPVVGSPVTGTQAAVGRASAGRVAGVTVAAGRVAGGTTSAGPAVVSTLAAGQSAVGTVAAGQVAVGAASAGQVVGSDAGAAATKRAVPTPAEGSACAASVVDQPEICLHWRRPAGTLPVAVAPLAMALLHAIDCQTEEAAIVMIDSALNSRKMSLARLRAAARQLPARYARVLDSCDATSQSGTETLVRLRLRRRGIRVRTQVQIGTVGRVDLLVGNRLVIECDSHAFHDGDEAAQRDYDRDLALIEKDYLVLRLNYRQIVYEWERVEPIILGLVARRRHLRPLPVD